MGGHGGGGGGTKAVISVSASEELMILKMILKTADIGNVTKGKEVCLGWTERVVDEFFTQGDLEAELKLPVTPFMDRKTADIPKQQIGFYNFIARPMFEALDGLVDMSTPLANLDLMYSHWSSQLPAEAPLPGVRASLVRRDSSGTAASSTPQPSARMPSAVSSASSREASDSQRA